MNKQKTAGASQKNAKCAQRPAGRNRGASQNGRSAAKASAKKQSTSSRRPCAAERVQAPKPKASGLQDGRQQWRIRDDRKLLQLARFPEQEPGVTLEYLLEQTSRRSVESVWESVLILTAIGYLKEVPLSDGSTGFALTELAMEREKLLASDQLELVRLPSAATVMRLDQLIALSGRPEDEVRAQLTRLVRRGFLERSRLGGGLVWPTFMGLQEAGFPRAYYSRLPRPRHWRHSLKVNDVHLALLEEFVPKDEEGNREWGRWQWVSERQRSRILSRTEKHLADGFLFNGRDFSLAVEIACSTPVGERLLIGMQELSRDYTEVRYYSSDKLSRNKITWALQKLKLRNVKLLEMPGEPLDELERIRL